MTYITPEQLARSAIRSMALAAQNMPVHDPAEHRSSMDDVVHDHAPEKARAETPSYITPEQSARSAIRSFELTLKSLGSNDRMASA